MRCWIGGAFDLHKITIDPSVFYISTIDLYWISTVTMLKPNISVMGGEGKYLGNIEVRRV